ncbi:hypothetical protein FB45DRAFT_1007134 [Roridomyces roridus]|uniref:Uncharacterized protein n=1 Tax=Roridomyces roridus TaxID=1738132 RepID=A0AAD7FHT5_9AGAR|nr:hypothetical protein FB45DRAFT_1007134 [Roridomyces roridus]
MFPPSVFKSSSLQYGVHCISSRRGAYLYHQSPSLPSAARFRAAGAFALGQHSPTTVMHGGRSGAGDSVWWAGEVIFRDQPCSRLLKPRGPSLGRGLGDMWLKFPVHVTNILFALKNETYFLNEVTKTPPYMLHTPDVLHADSYPGAFLILGSDGLEDVAFTHWGMDISDLVRAIAANSHHAGNIVAVELLWQVFGGDSEKNIYGSVSTGEYDRGRIDDITIPL